MGEHVSCREEKCGSFETIIHYSADESCWDDKAQKELFDKYNVVALFINNRCVPVKIFNYKFVTVGEFDGDIRFIKKYGEYFPKIPYKWISSLIGNLSTALSIIE